MPAIITAGTRTITAITSLKALRAKLGPLALLNLVLAIAMTAAGFGGVMATFLRLPSEIDIRAIRDGQLVTKEAAAAAMLRLKNASAFSNAAREDLAMAMLDDGEAPGSSADRIAADHAARQLQIYLASAPDDSFAWANLAAARLRRGTAGAAVAPYRLSIELAPADVSSLVWRCGFGIDIYGVLNADDRALLKKQFLMALDDSLDSSVSEQLARMVKQKNAQGLTSTLLSGDPDARLKLERLVSSLQ